MLRQLALVCLVTSAASAAPGKRALHLEPEDQGSAHHLLAAERAGDFPAVSDDGSTIAQLFQEGEDFTGAPITTLVLWSVKDGTRVASFRLGGFTDPQRPAEHTGKIAAYEWPILAAANTQLSRHLWNALPVAKPCGKEPESELCFPDRLVITFDQVSARFPSPGRRDGGGCGGTRGLAAGYGSRALGIVILEQAASLGGDSCFGLPTSDTVLALRVP